MKYVVAVLVGVALMLVFQSSTRAEAPAKIKSWEYRGLYAGGDLTGDFNDRIEKYNVLGAKGWELVAVEGPFGFFKRPKTKPGKPNTDK